MKKATVVLADDHRFILEGLKALLSDDFELAGFAEDGRALLELAEKVRPDVIIADISMPNLNGIDAINQLHANGIKSKVIFLTMHQDVTYAARAFDAGASGFVLKHSAPDELVTAIHQALQGRTYITPLIAQQLMDSYKKGDPIKTDGLAALTGRQREILQLLAEGKSAKETAAQLKISPRTVEFHKYEMMQKLSLKTSADLIQFAIRQGLISI